MVKLVASLTTIPSRLNSNTMIRVIESIRLQTKSPEKIYLTIPEYCKKINKPYPPLSPYLQQYCTVVNCKEDYGPICKIVGGLMMETEPDTMIITCDDDVVLPLNMFDELSKNAEQYPEAAVASTGMRIGEFPFYLSVKRNSPNRWYQWWTLNVNKNIPTDVDILCGYSSVLYRRGFFPGNYNKMLECALKYRDLFLNDDILISGWIGANNVKKYVFDLPILVDNVSGPDALSSDMVKFTMSAMNAIEKCELLGMYKDKIQLKPEDKLRTITALPVIVIAIILLWLFARIDPVFVCTFSTST